MSIIIRLQNLPWSANALDIRQFFHGLQIPEGGVHIVGGELGDAFIAFSTDEDARQAFLRTDGKIKGIQIKLMLSSRTEMQRVIEQARTQSMAAFMLPTTPVQVTPLPAAVPTMLPSAVPDLRGGDQKDNNNDDNNKNKRERRRSRSKSPRDRRDRSRDRSRRSSYRERSRSKSRDRRRSGGGDRRGRERSRSRNRSRDKDNNRNSSRRSDRRQSPKSPGSSCSDRRIDNNDNNDSNNKKSIPEIWSNRPQAIVAPSLSIIPPPQIVHHQSQPVVEGLLGAAPWNMVDGAALKPQLLRNFHSAAGFNNRDNNNWANQSSNLSKSWLPPLIPPIRPLLKIPPESLLPSFHHDDLTNINSRQLLLNSHHQHQHHQKRSRFDNVNNNINNINNGPINACVALEPFYGSYGDLRRFFNGLNIYYKGIKVINDHVGNKTGVCFVQFRDHLHKNEALRMDGCDLNGIEVKIRHISDQEFNLAIDRFDPVTNNGSTSSTSEGKFSTKKFNTTISSSSVDLKEFICLKIEDLPSYVTEQDILHIFSQHTLNSLHLNVKPNSSRGSAVAYIEFSTKEDAKLALNETELHKIRGRSVLVKPCTLEEFRRANPDDEVEEEDEEQEEEEDFEEDEKNLPKTPRINNIDTDCLNVTNLPTKCSDRDISDFFSDIGVIPAKIHLISNKDGFTGQAYCEFESMSDASRAVTKDATDLGQNRISVKAISRSDVEKVLGSSLPHPGLGPGQTLAPGTPLPPINLNLNKQQREISKEEEKEDGKNADEETNKKNDDADDDDQDEDEEEDEKEDAAINSQRNEVPRLNFEAPRPRFVDLAMRGGGFRGAGGNRGLFRGLRFPSIRGGGGGGGGGMSRFNNLRRGGGDNSSIMDDERPGCTVFMDNVPYKAGTNEILDFFDGFNSTNNVSRRYNPNNTPSAEAKVTFYNPDDAFKAVQELNGQPIWGRPIRLRQQ